MRFGLLLRAWSGLLLLVAAPFCCAQAVPVDQFLNKVAAHPAGDRAELQEANKVSQSLETASPEELRRVLPAILKYAAKGQEQHVRLYAVRILLGVALLEQRDGSRMLVPHSKEVAALIDDPDAEVQRLAVNFSYFLIEAVQGRDYGPALLQAMQDTRTPDATKVLVAPLLLSYMPVNAATESVHVFLRRGNLSPQIKQDAIRGINSRTQSKLLLDDLCAFFSDADPQVRVASIMAFYQTDRGSMFQREARSAVARVAADEREDPRIRHLAKYALAGCSNLNPNILVPNMAVPETPPNCPSSTEESIQ